MYVTGMTSLFNYGDHGPNKYSTTANAMMFYADQYNYPQYMLHQRDRIDAAEPAAVFWYNPAVEGNIDVKHQFFSNGTDFFGLSSRCILG